MEVSAMQTCQSTRLRILRNVWFPVPADYQMSMRRARVPQAFNALTDILANRELSTFMTALPENGQP
jgi:hypothetical protein